MEPPPLQIFLRTVILSLNQGTLVRNLTFASHRKGGHWRDLTPLTEEERAIVVQRLSRFDLPMAEQLDVAFSNRKTTLDATIAFILFSLPNLRAVHFGIHLYLDREPPYLFLTTAMIQKIIQSQRPTNHFQLLEEIECCSKSGTVDDERIVDFDDLLWFFYLPNIKIIKMCAVEMFEPLQWPLPAPSLPAMHTLKLQYSDISLDSLMEFLSTVPNLKQFEHHFRGDVDVDLELRGRDFLDCNRLRDVLEIRANSLERLVLSVGFYSYSVRREFTYCDHSSWGIAGSLGNMNSFTKLTFLKAPLIMLLGWIPVSTEGLVDNLPTTLQEFCCTNDMADFESFSPSEEDVVEHVVPLIDSHRLALQKFIAGREDGLHMWSDWVLVQVEEACRRTGILYELGDNLDRINYPCRFRY
ncbi:MAG: hypothetical protein Q9225_005677 [Loekoesia sp. 1 TL-2023]